eukprot:1078509_1
MITINLKSRQIWCGAFIYYQYEAHTMDRFCPYHYNYIVGSKAIHRILMQPKGKNNGTVQGEWYFKCEDKYGSFISNKSITMIPLINNESIDVEMMRNSSIRSGLSALSLESSVGSLDDDTYANLLLDILMTENDLAGFCLLWMIVLFYVVILRANQHQYVVDIGWFSIFCIPCIVCFFTWLFSYLITKYTTTTQPESMRIPMFYIPFLCKVFVAMVLFGRLIADMKERYGENKEYSALCTVALANVWFDCVLSIATAEILITTVQVNSIKNID